jgi:hypothetical protein
MSAIEAFRGQNTVLKSFPILRGAEAKEDFSAGWGQPCSTGPIDVIDLNGDGVANQPEVERKYGRDEVKEVRVTEPALHAPSYQKLCDLAQEQGQPILTQENLGTNLYLYNPRVVQVDDKTVQSYRDEYRPIDALVAENFDPKHPQASWALDTENHTLLIFEPHK